MGSCLCPSSDQVADENENWCPISSLEGSRCALSRWCVSVKGEMWCIWAREGPVSLRAVGRPESRKLCVLKKHKRCMKDRQWPQMQWPPWLLWPRSSVGGCCQDGWLPTHHVHFLLFFVSAVASTLANGCSLCKIIQPGRWSSKELSGNVSCLHHFSFTFLVIPKNH